MITDHKLGTGPHVTKFRPGKRIKAMHRHSDGSRTLKKFAKHVADKGNDFTGTDVKAAGQWMNKKFPGGW